MCTLLRLKIKLYANISSLTAGKHSILSSELFFSWIYTEGYVTPGDMWGFCCRVFGYHQLVFENFSWSSSQIRANMGKKGIVFRKNWQVVLRSERDIGLSWNQSGLKMGRVLWDRIDMTVTIRQRKHIKIATNVKKPTSS